MPIPPLLLTITFPYRTSAKNFLLYLTDFTHTQVGALIPQSCCVALSTWHRNISTASFCYYRTSAVMPDDGLTLCASSLTTLMKWILKKSPWAPIFWWVSIAFLMNMWMNTFEIGIWSHLFTLFPRVVRKNKIPVCHLAAPSLLETSTISTPLSECGDPPS